MAVLDGVTATVAEPDGDAVGPVPGTMKFSEAAGCTGIVLAKLDGTAKGGVVIAIRQLMGIPVKYVGLGEKIDDMQVFAPDDFVDALFGDV